MKWALRAYGVGLLIYTGYRTWSFMIEQLPAGTSGQMIALIFLLSAEIGLLLWHELSLRHTTTEVQHGVAVVMTWICFFASTGAGIGDMILKQTLNAGYEVPPLLVSVLIYGLPLIMALNVAASLIYFQNDAQNQIERAGREMEFAAQKEAMKEAKSRKKALAQDLKGVIVDDLEKKVVASIKGSVNGSKPKVYASESNRPKEKVRK